MNIRSLIINSILLLATAASAQDRVFTHTYQTNILPSGAIELEYWSTLRSGKEQFYNAIDQRLELELGLGKNVQTAFYMNIGTEAAFVKAQSIAELSSIHHSTNIGFSNEWKWKISDPVANRVGFGLYGEVGFDGQELDLEGKLLFDKKIGKGLFALNLVGEYEVEYEATSEGVEAVGEFPFELDAGYMYMLGEHAGLGLELRNSNVSSNEGGWEYSVIHAGPTLHFNGNRWFVNFNVMPQLANLKKAEGETGNLELHDHEKVEARVLLSFSF